MEIKIVRDKTSLAELMGLAQADFGEMVKAVVDIEKGIIAVGGEWHSDAERILLESDSEQKDLWGINLFPARERGQLIEFTSLINIRPRVGNRTMIIGIPEIKEKISQVVNKLFF